MEASCGKCGDNTVAEARALYKTATQGEKNMALPWEDDSRTDEAADLFARAGHFFKANEQLADAEKAYLKAATCLQGIGQLHEAATNFANAANAIRKTDAGRAANHLRSAATQLVFAGNLSIAAKNMQDAGELYEQEHDTNNAIDCLLTAARHYESEHMTSRASTCLLKVAQIHAIAGNYAAAAALYEQVARASVNNTLTKWSVPKYLFMAGLCNLCNGIDKAIYVVIATNACSSYTSVCASFAFQKEYTFLRDITDACRSNDIDGFTAVVQQYNELTGPDPFIAELFLRIKNSLRRNAPLS